MKQKLSMAMSLAVILAMLVTAVALADNINNDITVGGTDTITTGGSTTVRYKVVSTGGDGQPGCNAGDSTPLTLTLNFPGNVSASGLLPGNKLVFATCNDFQNVTFSSNVAGTYPITVSYSDSGAGAYNNNADFTLTVNAATPANQPPSLSMPVDITAEATGSSGAEVSYTVTASDAEDGELTPSCTPASGSTFALGVTRVDCSVTDSDGATTTGMFSVTVQDTTPPVVTVPADITAEATGSYGAAVDFSVSAYDLVDGAITPTCDYVSGSIFPLGITTVTCSATDAADKTGSASFNIAVVDTTPPVVTVPADISAEATGPLGAAIDFSASAYDLVDSAVTPTCAPASGSTFPLGTTTVACSATDAAGNTGSNSFSVTVQDTTPPVISGTPGNITAEATSAAGAVVTYTSPTANDLVDGAVAVNCSPASGSIFALGETTVTCTATDAHGNSAQTTFKVTVQDTTPPVVNVPGNITAEATGPLGAAVTFSTSASDIVDGALIPTCDYASGANFPIAATLVTCSATDAAGNTGSASFNITVQDTTPPALTLPSNITVLASSSAGAVVTFTATASDIVDGPVAVSCTPASGSTFAPGTTTVNCSATDAHNNTANGSFTITVSFRLSGFYQPVDMTTGSTIVWNTVRNGSTVPLKFEVFGTTELTSTSIVNQPLRAVGVACSTGTADDIELTSTGGTSLRYDTTGGQFIYNWQTPRNVGACYKVTVSFTDGSSLFAYFKLK